MQDAPLHSDIADGPDGGAAHWLNTADGVRIRAGHWPLDGAKGTVLILPGRTEFIEKYGLVAKSLQAAGYASVAIDWRGQGLADRLLEERALGHVGQFADYQHDVAALLAHASALDLPRPYYMLAHSMGGCIGLRSLMDGFDVQAVMFSAPMWGVTMSPVLRPSAWALSALSTKLGFDTTMSPGQSLESYVLREEFAKNTLTNDPDIWGWLKSQLEAHPELGLGGPTLRWLYLSLVEMRALSTRPSPAIPCLTFLGTKEAIVDPQRIRDRMKQWPDGKLRVIDGGQHEMLMDKPAMREMLMAETIAFFDAHS